MERPAYLAAVDRILYPITVGYTLVIMGFTLYEFFQGGAFKSKYPITDVYLPLLTAYAAQREGAKWLGADESAMRLRRGELFVGAWFAVYLALWSAANLRPEFVLPQELKAIALGVLGIFAVTGISSTLRQRRTQGAVKAGFGPFERREKMLQLLNEKGALLAEEAAQALSLSPSTAWRVLEDLEKEGAVVQMASANPQQRRYQLKK